MSGAFNIKNFLDGFHNDDVFYNSPEDYLYGTILNYGKWISF
jgi:esterase/lipase superfamily enzyme